MTAEQAKWLQVMVRPAVSDAQPNRLDDHVTQSVPGAVTQHLEDGRYSYQPNDQGEYEVRLFEPSLINYLEVIVKHNAFEISRVIQMPEGIEIQ